MTARVSGVTSGLLSSSNSGAAPSAGYAFGNSKAIRTNTSTAFAPQGPRNVTEHVRRLGSTCVQVDKT
jgi:hypothetical protein